jgi:tRNA splicing ligase
LSESRRRQPEIRRITELRFSRYGIGSKEDSYERENEFSTSIKIKVGEIPDYDDYDGRSAHSRTPAPTRTLKAATANKQNKIKTNHAQLT